MKVIEHRARAGAGTGLSRIWCMAPGVSKRGSCGNRGPDKTNERGDVPFGAEDESLGPADSGGIEGAVQTRAFGGME